MRFNLATKVVGTLLLVLAILFSVAAYWATTSSRTLLEQQHFKRAMATARLLDATVSSAARLPDREVLFNAMQRVLWLEPEVVAIQIAALVGDSLEIIASTMPGQLRSPPLEAHHGVFRSGTAEQWLFEHMGSRRIRTVTPIHISRGIVGTIQVDVTLETLDAEVSALAREWTIGIAVIAAVTAVTLLLMLRKFVLSPVSRLASAVEAVANDERDLTVEINSADELGTLAARFNHMMHELRQVEARIERLAYHDALTGLPNRRYLLNRLEQAIAHTQRYGRTGAIIFIDLDGFKQINDTCGHAEGDHVLHTVASRLAAMVREVDTVARLGGDEFVVLIDQFATSGEAEQATALAGKLRQELLAPIPVAGGDVRVTSSIGIRLLTAGEGSPDELLREADSAMYEAKKEGRNRVCLFQAAHGASARRRTAVTADLRTAITQRAMGLHFHPQVSANGEIAGAEALLRWTHPRLGPIPPEECVAIADDLGLIKELGEQVARGACMAFNQCNHGRTGTTRLPRVAINVSPRQFMNDGFRDGLLAVRDHARLPYYAMEIELTERSLVVDIDHAANLMQEMREEGFRFAIDDFGLGYSSFMYLKRFPVDEIKIDRSFVQDILALRRDRAIVSTMINMARESGIDVVVEGVESRQQYDALRDMGCSLFQGNYFSPPVDADSLLSLIGTNLLNAETAPLG